MILTTISPLVAQEVEILFLITSGAASVKHYGIFVSDFVKKNFGWWLQLGFDGSSNEAMNSNKVKSLNMI